ncbi:hypothetical protein HPB49_005605 [Dermacentor silvarum]|uniref:Uncharacterized protein n=1 Tax=Dermacentor silvarum TaxID=543639 RepID=A0ACB8DVV6_DERSI|nr:hypothetical protein HPB49_005605 [Dermacentor silvarum]
MACGGGDPCIAGPSTRKRSFSFLSSSLSDDDSDTDVYLVSGSDDSDDGELSSSSGDDEDSSETNIASARQWILLDVDNPPVKPPRFPFLAIPGKTFNLSSSDDLMEYIQQFLDDELISLVVDETNRKAVETLKRSPQSEHSRLKKWVPVTKEEIGDAGRRSPSPAKTVYLVSDASCDTDTPPPSEPQLSTSYSVITKDSPDKQSPKRRTIQTRLELRFLSAVMAEVRAGSVGDSLRAVSATERKFNLMD